jgi:hypothetical protein
MDGKFRVKAPARGRRDQGRSAPEPASNQPPACGFAMPVLPQKLFPLQIGGDYRQ